MESLTGYLQRLANEYQIPPEHLFREQIVPAIRRHGLWTSKRADLLRRNARGIDGAGRAARIAIETLSCLTGRSDLVACALVVLTERDFLHEDALLVRQKRWCPCCWREDIATANPYERKLWTLSVVDACPVHMTSLVERCFACGRQQPPISMDVRPGICALCGESLMIAPVPLPKESDISDATRQLWYARQAAILVHAVDVAELHGIRACDLSQARQVGLEDMSARVFQEGGSPALIKQIRHWRRRWGKPKIEELFSVLWRARWPVANLFPKEVREVVDSRLTNQ